LLLLLYRYFFLVILYIMLWVKNTFWSLLHWCQDSVLWEFLPEFHFSRQRQCWPYYITRKTFHHQWNYWVLYLLTIYCWYNQLFHYKLDNPTLIWMKSE
jgi:hypothetical protein